MPRLNAAGVGEFGKSAPDAAVFAASIGKIVVQHDKRALSNRRSAKGQGLACAGEGIAVDKNDTSLFDAHPLCSMPQRFTEEARNQLKRHVPGGLANPVPNLWQTDCKILVNIERMYVLLFKGAESGERIEAVELRVDNIRIDLSELPAAAERVAKRTAGENTELKIVSLDVFYRGKVAHLFERIVFFQIVQNGRLQARNKGGSPVLQKPQPEEKSKFRCHQSTRRCSDLKTINFSPIKLLQAANPAPNSQPAT